MKFSLLFLAAGSALLAGCSSTKHLDAEVKHVTQEFIAEQNERLAKNAMAEGAGPQSPRDLGALIGTNKVNFLTAPASTSMNLCNIHFHHSAEHKGGEFTTFAGSGDGRGHHTGYKYSGQLNASELAPATAAACPSEHGGLKPGDTIELHYVHSSAPVKPGPTLGACLSEAVKDPYLRVQTQVMVLVNDKSAYDFGKLTEIGEKNGYQQAVNMLNHTGMPIQYAGSTTGPAYNEKPSPLKVSWSVRPQVVKVNIDSVGAWCKGNVFKEDHAHAVRNLVTRQELLSPIKQ